MREQIDDWAGVATTDGNLAILAEFEGDYTGAREINDGALGLRHRIGDRRGIGIGEMNAGYYRILTGDLDGRRARTSRRRSACRASSATGRWSPTPRSRWATPSATAASTGRPRPATPRRSSSSATSTIGSR